MTINHISELPFSKKRAVIINVNTRWVTTLALLSALRHARMPVLVIDCESKDGSLAHFERLMKKHEFDLLTAPLKQHGHTLDWLFKNISAEYVLLIDSDAEILNRSIFDIIDDSLQDPRMFGCGFVHGPEWMTKVQFGFDHEKLGLYQERMWIPFSMLNTAIIREALGAGFSFAIRMIYNDFPPSQRVSKFLFSRFNHERWVRSRLRFLNPFRGTYYNAKPSYVFCDTGADIFQHLRYEKNYLFVGLPVAVHKKYISHFHGVTRKMLDSQDQNSTAIDTVWNEILTRLRGEYGITVPSHEK
jgi:glycosyltransferase involved in cell wall biosynthesis